MVVTSRAAAWTFIEVTAFLATRLARSAEKDAVSSSARSGAIAPGV